MWALGSQAVCWLKQRLDEQDKTSGPYTDAFKSDSNFHVRLLIKLLFSYASFHVDAVIPSATMYWSFPVSFSDGSGVKSTPAQKIYTLTHFPQTLCFPRFSLLSCLASTDTMMMISWSKTYIQIIP